MTHDASPSSLRLLRPIDRRRDHLRPVGGHPQVLVVGYADFLCPYCRRLREVFARLREVLGERYAYAFRHFPNERAHPGAELVARAAEAAAMQGRFWEMHDALFDHELPIAEAEVLEIAGALRLDLERFRRDMDGDAARERVADDLAAGRENGITGTPTLFIDGLRYDGAWDFHSLLEGLDRPVGARLHRSARVFASLPASGGIVLLIAALLAIFAANTGIAPLYERIMNTDFGLGPTDIMLSMTVREWLSEGLLSFFFLLVGVEIRREMTVGALADRRAAILPVVAAVGGVVAPALVYLAFNRGPTSHGWSVPTATDIAFTLGILAVLGTRIPTALLVFVAALAVVDDVLSVLTLAIFYPRSFEPTFLVATAAAVLGLFALNRARVYQLWPYAAVAAVLWLSLHAAGVHAALAGVVLALCLPTRAPPKAAPLLAQAATALAALEHAEDEARRVGDEGFRAESEPVWDWAAENLSAASARLLSPTDRVERAVSPWSAYFILPLFAFSATGVSLAVDFSAGGARDIFLGVVVALVVGKPVGVLAACAIAVATGVAVVPRGLTRRHFIGAACLCGVADTVALLIADRAFSEPENAAVAKVAVLVGSTLAGTLGALVLRRRIPEVTPVVDGRS